MQQFSKYFYFLLLFLFCFQTISAQEPDKTVSITVSGSGKTQDEAKQSALRSAIEQAFGAFISSKTEMFNDKVVADQIASVANGNIQSFAILTESQLPDGSWGITLKAVVSVSKLTSFVAAKGISIEIKGGMFALNIKQQLLNEQGEIKAIAEMVGLLHEPMQISFDYIIKSSDPKSLDAESKNWEIPLVVTATTNKNMDFCATYCVKTLEALTLTAEEVQNYKQLNKKVFPVTVNYSGIRKTYYLRKQGSIDILNTLGSQWEFYTRLFTVQSGMDEKIGIGEDKLHQFISSSNNYNSYDNDDAYSFNFLSSGQIAGTFSWSDKRTLAEIEKITDYSVKPRGVISAFKYGGFVIYEKDGKGLVLGISDLGGEKFWKEANNACNELVLNGYDDWRLPKPEEFREIHKSRFWWNIGNLKQQTYYWSNYLEVDKNFYSSGKIASAKTFFLNRNYTLLEDLKDTSVVSDYYKHAVRPVRTFPNNITIQDKNTSTIPSDISGLTEEELQDKNLSQLLIYSGIYNVTDKLYANLGFKILITFENEKLFLAFTSDRENTEDKKLEIKKTTLDEFENQELKVKIQFNRDDKGKIASLKYLFKKTEINAVK